jgi:hypothetical protein
MTDDTLHTILTELLAGNKNNWRFRLDEPRPPRPPPESWEEYLRKLGLLPD